MTTNDTKASTPTNAPTMPAIAAPAPTDRAGALGIHVCPFQRHLRSGEIVDFHSLPSQYHIPSGDTMGRPG